MTIPAPIAPQLSIVVPGYNETSRLPKSIPGLIEYLDRAEFSAELILSDDGSTDGTFALMEEYAASRPYIKAVGYATNRGKGRAVANGVAASSGMVVLISDADFSTPIEEVFKVWAPVTAGAGVAIGSRALSGEGIVHQPWYRTMMGRVFNLCVQVIILPGLWDTQCGFKLFRGDLARTIFAEMRSDGFAFDVEAIYLARRAGETVKEVPVKWVNDTASKVSPIKDSIKMLVGIIKIRFGLLPIPPPVS